MRVLVFGETGQVASALRQQAAQQGIALTALGRGLADLADPGACAAALEQRLGTVDLVINAAAYTAVDKAENDRDLAHAVNALSPSAIARVAAAAGLPFLHISTDYVFDGTGASPRTVADPVAPLGVYGHSKLAGEAGIREADGPHVILRTSWVFSETGTNFVKTMLRLGASRDNINVVADQIGGPTPARAIAGTLLQMAKAMYRGQGASGTYHYSGAPDVSWADFARAIFAAAGMAVTVTDIPTSAYPTPARRPANSRLDCSALLADFGIDRPDWGAGLAQVLRDLG